MSAAVVPWPCPVCAELVTVGLQDCPFCRTPAAWIDLLRALDFSIRQFHYWSLTGVVDKQEYRAIVDSCRQRREEMTQLAQSGAAVPADTGLPSQAECWNCHQPCRPNVRFCGHCGSPLDTPEVRLIRYQTFLQGEIQKHEQAGHLAPPKAEDLRKETRATLQQIRERLSGARDT